MQTKQSLIDDIRRAGINPGDVLMLHASMRAVGLVEGGAEELLKAFIEGVGVNGTLMMYIGCEGPYDDVGRGNLTPEEEADAIRNLPAFDPVNVPAVRDHGILAEIFRQHNDAIFSHNPGGRMGAIGRHAMELMADHPLQYGYGDGSPLDKLYQRGGKVVLIGSDSDAVTVLHYAEDRAPVSDKRIVRIKSPLMVNGVRTWVDIEEFDTSIGIRRWPDRFFTDIVARFVKERKISSHLIGQAQTYILPARDLVDFSIPVFVEQAKVSPP